MSFLKSPAPSSFAPAERKEADLIKVESEQLKQELKRCSILDMLPDPVVILNTDRQILFANQTLINFLHLNDDSSILGMRPGEMLDCAHAKNDSGGCGTTEFCSVCGAVKAILHTQKFNNSITCDCQIITTSDKAYNFRCWTSPFSKNSCDYTLMVIRDITDEVYRNSLERIFFHDLLNIGSGLYGLLGIINDDPESYQENHQLLVGLTEELLEEINSQKDLLKAEKGSIDITLKPVRSVDVMKFVADMFVNHQVAKDKNILLEKTSENIDFKTDPCLLKRILINMVKNALEASVSGDSIILKSSVAGNNAVFEVYNKGYIQQEVQLQIFNRAFSTKGCGRGLGTYSAKLLAERYLQGKVYFISSVDHGTSFFVELPLHPEIPPASAALSDCP